MDGALTVRPATPEDDAALLRLDVGEAGTGFPSVFARSRTSFFGPGEPADTLVCVQENRVVGYLTLTHPTPLPENAHVFAVEGFTVDPAWRGRGIARLLLAAAATEAARRGGRKLSLRVLGTNARAQHVYRAAGFVVEGTLRGEFVIDSTEVDDVLMSRPL